jgi:hypothetical protein
VREQGRQLFILDVEATAPTPMTGVMTEFALAHVSSEHTFYGHLYNAHPHPNNPAVPQLDSDEHGDPVVVPYWVVGDGVTSNRHDTARMNHVGCAVRKWVGERSSGDRPILVSDNPGYDAMWFNCFMDSLGLTLPFGHSSRRIGDFYAGLKRNWRNSSSWKRLRRTPHTHNPLDDEVGNREALREILEMQ